VNNECGRRQATTGDDGRRRTGEGEGLGKTTALSSRVASSTPYIPTTKQPFHLRPVRAAIHRHPPSAIRHPPSAIRHTLHAPCCAPSAACPVCPVCPLPAAPAHVHLSLHHAITPLFILPASLEKNPPNPNPHLTSPLKCSENSSISPQTLSSSLLSSPASNVPQASRQFSPR
jgi:hypothetical protein